jgi:DNA ligase-1
MQRFTQLYLALDQSTRTTEKIEVLKAYFRDAPPRDSVWALYLLTGRKIGRTVSSTQVREWAVEATGLPRWLVDECNLVAGDFSETLALLLPAPREGAAAESLHGVIEELQSLSLAAPDKQRDIMRGLWGRLNSDERFVLHKLISGNFRVGVSEILVIRALAETVGIEPAAMAHRLAGRWRPTEAAMLGFLSAEVAATRDPSLPYPFMLAHALSDPLESLGTPGDWLLECKWDGIRAQIIRREGKAFLWSRGDQPVADAFPELVHSATSLPDGAVLDGEIVGWNAAQSRPLPFSQLQTRINRKRVEMSFWPDVDVRFLAFDVLEFQGRDIRSEPLRARRDILAKLIGDADNPLRASTPLLAGTWEELRSWLREARESGLEGVMLKRMDSVYVPGRPTGPWWKLKVQPFSVDAVLIAAQPGHGRRAGLLTDYTFGVWEGDKLVPIAKAYSGLTDAELIEMDRYIRQNSRERFGPVYAVPPERVFELGFEQIQRSTRHKSGIAVRFPRILRMRSDKKPADADTLETLRRLLNVREKLGE